MKSIRWLFLLFLFPLLSVPASAVVPGDRAPAWKGQDLATGALVRFPEVLAGKPAIVIFWATWCPYCKAFMPYARELQQEFAAHGVRVVTLNAKERGRGDPAAYVRSLKMPMTAIAAADDIAQSYNVAFIPGLFVVDGDGTVVYRRRSTNLPAGKTVAGQWADEVRAVLSELVEPASPAAEATPPDGVKF